MAPTDNLLDRQIKEIDEFEIKTALFDGFPNFYRKFWNYHNEFSEDNNLKNSYEGFLKESFYRVEAFISGGEKYFELLFGDEVLKRGKIDISKSNQETETEWFKIFASHFESLHK